MANCHHCGAVLGPPNPGQPCMVEICNVFLCGPCEAAQPACSYCAIQPCRDHIFQCATAGCGPVCADHASVELNHDPTTATGVGISTKCRTHLNPAALIETTRTVVSLCAHQTPLYDATHLDCWSPDLRLYPYGVIRHMAPPAAYPSGQREHLIPNSCLVRSTRRDDIAIHDAPTYSEDAGLCYWVDDGQTHGKEHKYLTDFERNFGNYLEHVLVSGDLTLWFAYMEAKIELCLMSGHFRHKVPNPACALGAADCAKQAAHAMRRATERYYTEAPGPAPIIIPGIGVPVVPLGIPVDAMLRNGPAAGSAASYATLRASVVAGTAVTTDIPSTLANGVQTLVGRITQ